MSNLQYTGKLTFFFLKIVIIVLKKGDMMYVKEIFKEMNNIVFITELRSIDKTMMLKETKKQQNFV